MVGVDQCCVGVHQIRKAVWTSWAGLSIAEQAGRSAHHGWAADLGLLGFLSVSLGLLNLLP
jgi:membrane-associated protease RseP (regulator of RpoE activity)